MWAAHALEGRHLKSLVLYRQVGRLASSNPPRGAVPFSDGPQSRKRWVPPLQGGWDCGIAYLALKRQAIQISPFQGEPPTARRAPCFPSSVA